MPAFLHALPPDTVAVFATEAELLAHHRRVPLAVAQSELESLSLPRLTLEAMAQAKRLTA